MKHQKSILAIIFITVTLDLLGFGILIPVIPLLFTDPSSTSFILPAHFSLQTGYLLLGLLVGTFPLMQFFSTPLLGQMSDHFGRRPVLIASIIGTACGYVLFALGILTRNISLLFAARALDGLTGGNVAVAQAAIADITKPEDRAKNFGLIGGAFGIGFILGPFIGGKLADSHIVSWFNASTPFWVAALLSIINVILIYFFLPETVQKNRGRALAYKFGQSIENIYKAFRIKGLGALFATSFLFWGGFTFFTTFFPVFLAHRFGFHESDIGTFFAYTGIWIGISQIGIGRLVSNRFTEDRVLRYTLLLNALFTFLFFIPHAPWELYIVVPIFAVVNGLCQANIPGIISRVTPSTMQGEVLGVNASVQALSQTVPPIISGIIAATIAPSAPLVVSAFVVGASWLIFIVYYKAGTKVQAFENQ